jgi:hypothetical protein
MMAEVAAPITQNGAPLPLTAEELREILEYEKIVQFRDAVFAGTHPRIKIPPHLAGKQIDPSRNVSSPSLATPRPNTIAQYTRSASGTHQERYSPYHHSRSPNNYRGAIGGHVPMSSKSEINPVLLEKSDDLIRAEIQLQRQRLERALREQIDQQKLATKALLQTSESLPSFDLSEVLSKALALVHPSASAEVEPSVDVQSPASDSFDENTFYSSQHDTPDRSHSPSKQKEPGEVQPSDLVSIDERPADGLANKRHHQDVLSNDNHLASQLYSQAQTRSTELQPQTLDMANSESSSSRGAHVGDTSDVSSQRKEEARVSAGQINPTWSIEMTAQQTIDQIKEQVSTEQLLQQAFAKNTTSPLIRAHNLSPVAPQPARVSPLATARAPPIIRETRLPDEAQLPQVIALRQPPPGISSTDSSQKGVKSADRKKTKKEKKKKRKASSNDNAGTPESPYIKPEPRSPSPFSMLPLPRPQKRQRHMGQFAAELNYDEPTGEIQERIPERYEEDPASRTYERFEERYEQVPRRAEPHYQRLDRGDRDYNRVGGGESARRHYSPTLYALPYTPGETRQMRAASHSMVERRTYEEPIYYREPVPRYSVHPDANLERSRSPIIREKRSPIPMGPPRAPVRIIVDAYGREYIDPTPPPSLRQSVAPPPRYRDSDVVYERAPTRTVSTRVPVEAYNEGGVVYRRPSPPIVVPRRVTTQPEYATPDYRSYRQREYSARPTALAPSGQEYIQVRGPVERRQVSHFEEAPREYAARAPSARPEPVRYEIPREYVGRLQSVRPDPPPREFATSVRPEARREIPVQSQREFSVRPADSAPRRDPVPGPESERYYDDISARRGAEVAFIERPRARESSVVVYADDVRREVYR